MLFRSPIDWDSKVSELDGGMVDCLWNGFTTNPEREGQMLMSEPYMTNRQVIVVPKGSSIKTLADLKGKTLTLQGGSTAADALEANPEVKDSLKEAAEVKNNVLALYDLGNGSSDAVLMDEVVARYYTGHQDQLASDAKAE